MRELSQWPPASKRYVLSRRKENEYNIIPVDSPKESRAYFRRPNGTIRRLDKGCRCEESEAKRGKGRALQDEQPGSHLTRRPMGRRRSHDSKVKGKREGRET